MFHNLDIRNGQALLIRGGTSSLGQVAINLAVNAGVKVIATTRNLNRSQMILDLGTYRLELEALRLADRFKRRKQ